MTTESKIFLSVVFIIIAIFGFMNFEIAIDSYNMSIANQNKIDSLEYKISLIEEMQNQDTIKVKIVK